MHLVLILGWLLIVDIMALKYQWYLLMKIYKGQICKSSLVYSNTGMAFLKKNIIALLLKEIKSLSGKEYYISNEVAEDFAASRLYILTKDQIESIFPNKEVEANMKNTKHILKISNKKNVITMKVSSFTLLRGGDSLFEDVECSIPLLIIKSINQVC